MYTDILVRYYLNSYDKCMSSTASATPSAAGACYTSIHFPFTKLDWTIGTPYRTESHGTANNRTHT
jgi:hypothetical protein